MVDARGEGREASKGRGAAGPVEDGGALPERSRKVVDALVAVWLLNLRPSSPCHLISRNHQQRGGPSKPSSSHRCHLDPKKSRRDVRVPGPFVVFKTRTTMLMPLCTIHGVEDGSPVMNGDWEHEEGKVHMARQDSQQIGNMGVA